MVEGWCSVRVAEELSEPEVHRLAMGGYSSFGTTRAEFCNALEHGVSGSVDEEGTQNGLPFWFRSCWQLRGEGSTRSR